MKTADLIHAIETAENLDDLLEALRAAEAYRLSLDRESDEYADLHDRLEYLYTDLPYWGDDYQGDESGVASCDGTRLLLMDDDLHLAPRGDIAHSMPSRWTFDDHRDVWYLQVGEQAASAIVAEVGQADDGSWWLVVEGGGCERWEQDGHMTSKEAAEAGGDHIGWYVSQEAVSCDAINLLAGTQANKAARLGASQAAVQQWGAGGEMSRVSRHSLLAQLGAVRSVRTYEPTWVWR